MSRTLDYYPFHRDLSLLLYHNSHASCVCDEELQCTHQKGVLCTCVVAYTVSDLSRQDWKSVPSL
jgi:hypothetical protein